MRRKWGNITGDRIARAHGTERGRFGLKMRLASNTAAAAGLLHEMAPSMNQLSSGAFEWSSLSAVAEVTVWLGFGFFRVGHEVGIARSYCQHMSLGPKPEEDGDLC